MAVAVGAAALGASESAAYRCSSVSAVAEGAGSAASEASGMPQQLTQEQWEQRFRQWQQHFLSVLQQQGGEQAEQQSMQMAQLHIRNEMQLMQQEIMVAQQLSQAAVVLPWVQQVSQQQLLRES